MYIGASKGIFFANLVLPEKNLKNKVFVSLTQVFKLLVRFPKIIKTYITVT